MNIGTEGCPVSHRTAFLLQLHARAIERLSDGEISKCIFHSLKFSMSFFMGVKLGRSH
jgi:hypothetical protein